MTPLRRVWTNLPEFRYANDARACAEDVERFFGIAAKTQDVLLDRAGTGKPLLCHAVALPDGLDPDLQLQIETFIVAWGAGSEYGNMQWARRDR